MCWAGNTSTRCCIHTSCSAWNVAGSSGARMSMPRTSAPRAGCSGRTFSRSETSPAKDAIAVSFSPESEGMVGELKAHRARVVVDATVLHDQEQRLLIAAVVVRMHGDGRRDRGRPGRPVLALAINHREAAI